MHVLKQVLCFRDDPLFSSKPSWDSLFSDLPDTASQPSHRHTAKGKRLLGAGAAPRRQSMTVREMTAFDDMFSRIFNAATVHPTTPQSPNLFKPIPNGNEDSMDALKFNWAGRATDGVATQDVDDLFGQIRRHSKRVQWTSEADEEFDRKKEEMNLCETDHQLLEWAQREVFDESKRYEEVARLKLSQGTSSSQEQVQLQPLAYPHLIAYLMRTFREKYSDPHLALSIFSHARHLSIPSFVFGCTTSAYNELLETKWACFRDLRGIVDALEEMQVNGVPMDSRTKALCEMVRRECGARELWGEERNVGSGEVWEMLQFIDKVVAGVNDKMFKERRRVAAPEDGKQELGAWKSRAFLDGSSKEEDSWEFGKWDDDSRMEPDARLFAPVQFFA
ncbi:hypothetical protein EUX98_g1880 [Antrodiella citrinella]|uniref:Mtf2-like C-terminal domain-containing protein n=1 Tax=Antrodiella citrinella TaxID=2447956 RepID=A0A4S4N1S7_9APHY|nr:hypothetical protein EUX98_g1880 [Antrodiella citrinella]